jgi:uncharacterized surface protein with fasciclin (FAS1) repeats
LALAVVASAVAACSIDAPEVRPPAPAVPAVPLGASPGGVTTPSQAFGPDCGQLPQNGAPGAPIKMASQPVATAMASNPLLATFSGAIQKAGLFESLNTSTSATVFAPDEAAFTDLQQSMGPDRYNALLADSAALGDILKYQIVVRRYDRAALGAAGNVTTLEGATLQVKNVGDNGGSGGGMEITDSTGQTAQVLCGNLPTANATVFVIDKVLMPKTP